MPLIVSLRINDWTYRLDPSSARCRYRQGATSAIGTQRKGWDRAMQSASGLTRCATRSEHWLRCATPA
jgi:hypothetical protein